MMAKSPVTPAATDPGISDDTLIARIAAGDQTAFTSFMQRHGNFLFANAVRMMRTRSDAEDAVQDTMLKVWQKADSWRPDTGATVRTWLYRIAHNVCIDMLRRRKPQVAMPELLADTARTDKDLIDSERAQLIERALQELPARQRAALVLCHYQGLSNSEAAAVIGTSIKGVESLLIRARRQMRAVLEPQRAHL